MTQYGVSVRDVNKTIENNAPVVQAFLDSFIKNKEAPSPTSIDPNELRKLANESNADLYPEEKEMLRQAADEIERLRAALAAKDITEIQGKGVLLKEDL